MDTRVMRRWTKKKDEEEENEYKIWSLTNCSAASVILFCLRGETHIFMTVFSLRCFFSNLSYYIYISKNCVRKKKEGCFFLSLSLSLRFILWNLLFGIHVFNDSLTKVNFFLRFMMINSTHVLLSSEMFTHLDFLYFYEFDCKSRSIDCEYLHSIYVNFQKVQDFMDYFHKNMVDNMDCRLVL